MDDFMENCVGRWSNNYTSEESMSCFGRFSNTLVSEGNPILLPKFGSSFREQKAFVLKTLYFYSHSA